MTDSLLFIALRQLSLVEPCSREFCINKTFSCKFHPKIKFSVFFVLPNNHRLGKSVYIKFIHGKRHRTRCSNGRETHTNTQTKWFVEIHLWVFAFDEMRRQRRHSHFTDLTFLSSIVSALLHRNVDGNGTERHRRDAIVTHFQIKFLLNISHLFLVWFRKFRFFYDFSSSTGFDTDYYIRSHLPIQTARGWETHKAAENEIK